MSWLLLALLACGPKDGDSDPTAPTTGSTTSLPTEPVDAFKVLADRAGYEVREGQFDFLDHAKCCQEGWNCLWNNPSTPYGLYAFEPLPDQTGENTMLDDEGRGRSFHLREDEVLVLLGSTPPEARYFSYRSYVSWRPSETPVQLVIGSLGASLNNQVVADQLGTSPYAADIAIVTSTDAGLEAEVHGMLEQAGWTAPQVFDDRMVHAEGRYGLGPDADQFMAVTRTAVIADPAAKDAYYADPGLTLLRLTPRQPREITQPHGRPQLPSRGTGTDEDAWTDALDALGDAIQARYTGPYDPVVQLANHFWFETLDCIDAGHCSGDIRDRYYSRVPNFTMPDDGTFAVVYGVNHERTGKASYSNFAVDTVEAAIGLEAVNSRDMVGSAREFLPDHPQADDLYAWVVARDCAAMAVPNCIEVPTDCPGVPLTDPMLVSFRAYLEPQTGAAPIEPELLADRVIRYTPAGP